MLSDDQLSVVMSDVLKGLKVIHEDHSIMHRDLKAANILLDSSGAIGIADFGVSKRFVKGRPQRSWGVRSG
jgi:serine/threonine protein kinase